MNDSSTRHALLAKLRAVATRDQRIVGMIDYGSGAEGRADAWSDIDLAIFVRDADLATFQRDWKNWATQFGPLLLAYIGGVGHPWAVYDTEPLPLRVDFAFWSASQTDIVRTWPLRPLGVETMVLLDRTDGALTAAARDLIGRSLSPQQPATTFEKVCGDLWYYLLRTDARLRRGQLDEVCRAIATQRAWLWPEQLSERVQRVISAPIR